MSLKQWTDVYPQGTKAGDEEQAVFIALARHPKWTWRSVSALAKEANITKVRVEEILYKYWKMGMVFQNPASEEQWGYWERVPEEIKKEKGNLASEDNEARLKKVGVNP